MDIPNIPSSIKNKVRRLMAKGLDPVVCAVFDGPRLVRYDVRTDKQKTRAPKNGMRCIVVG